MAWTISRSLLASIIQAAAAQSTEICGLILGRPGYVDNLVPVANVAPNPVRHFELDPAALIAAHRAARSGGPQIVGHYHSHPSGVATPSATDAACAAADGALWMIVAGGQVRLWIAGELLFEEVELIVA